MAYNLNYNPGTEYERHLQRRKFLMISILILVVLVMAALIFIGLANRKVSLEKATSPNSFSVLSDEKKSELTRKMTATSTSSVISQNDQPKLTQSMSANEGTGASSQPEETISGKQQEDLLKAMSAKQ